MATKDDFLPLEKKFWTGNADWYRKNLDNSCLVAFTEMSGLYGKEDIAATIKDEARWRNLDLSVKGFLEPAPGVAILTYEAHATRAKMARTTRRWSALATSSETGRGKWRSISRRPSKSETLLRDTDRQ